MRRGALIPAIFSAPVLALILSSCQGAPSARIEPLTGYEQMTTPRVTSLDLMPYPQRVLRNRGTFSLSGLVPVRLHGPASPRVTAAVDRLAGRLARFTSDRLALAPSISESGARQLVLEWRSTAKLSASMDESYTLTVRPDGIGLRASTDVGILRGVATLSQLALEAAVVPGVPSSIPAVTITDRPRFAWRGLLLDCVRHFMPVDTIKRLLRGMAAVKLNVFHWHLTDDQGFRVESRIFPRLTQEASGGEYYSQDQVREVVRFADELGIRVVPEFDVPAHTSAILSAYPSLGTGPGPFTVETGFGVFNSVLDPTREETYSAIGQFLAEMAQLFPDEYVHIGGDENNGRAWAASPEIADFMKAHDIPDFVGLTRYFTGRVERILHGLGKRAIVWEEAWDGSRNDSLAVQVWAEPDLIRAAAAAGQKVVRSQRFYLDLMFPASYHYAVDPAAGISSADGLSSILGGEAAMWSELVTPQNLDSRIWPRLAAIAERLWSSAALMDTADMYRRLDITDGYLDRIGMRERSSENQMLVALAGGRESGSLRLLADVLEPLKGYRRISSERYTVSTPLDRLVDAIPPESETARDFSSLVASAISDTRSLDRRENDLKLIGNWLSLWRANDAVLAPSLEREPRLKELVPVSARLERAAAVGLDATHRLTAALHGGTRSFGVQTGFGAGGDSRGRKADILWAQGALKVLDEASAWNSAQVSIAVLGAIRKLVEAVVPAAAAAP